jgi:cell wall assembly regulator SMI1
MYFWWLDIETGNTWDSSAGGQQRNLADIEGMVAYFRSISTEAGIYSTSYQLGQIAGTIPTSSPINNVMSWIPGARSLSGAQANCSLAPLTSGGKVVITQWFGRTFDQDYSCI